MKKHIQTIMMMYASITKAPAFLHVSLSDIFFRVPIEFQHKAPFSIS